jgi:hypothetical protein
MPDHPDPAHPEEATQSLSRRATRAIRSAIELAGGPAAFARVHAVAPRTAERLRDGDREVPPGLAREVAASLDHVTARRAADHAEALRAWAEHRERADA